MNSPELFLNWNGHLDGQSFWSADHAFRLQHQSPSIDEWRTSYNNIEILTSFKLAHNNCLLHSNMTTEIAIPDGDAVEEEQMMYGLGALTEQELNEK
jgi:hypothetical protein